VRPYGIPKHRHLSEIEEQLGFAAGESVVIQFSPHLIPINRGILTTLYLLPEKGLANEAQMTSFREQIAQCYQTAYGQEPFVRILDGAALPDTKNVAGTNVIEIAWRLDPRTGRLIVMSALDNITKGASGQAVQSMNILRGWAETAGLL
jgi:N-acetyl-gamma-glutamyl-phosphate reductase